MSYYAIGLISGKHRVKFGNFVNFPAIILNRVLLIIIWYLFHNLFWPQPPEIGLGLGLEVLASFNITGLVTTLTILSLLRYRLSLTHFINTYHRGLF